MSYIDTWSLKERLKATDECWQIALKRCKTKEHYDECQALIVAMTHELNSAKRMGAQDEQWSQG